MAQGVIHVVQHLRPGGIENLVLEMLRVSPATQEVHIVSLEGDKETALRHWKRPRPHADHLHFLQKSSGIRPGTLFRLARLFRRLRPSTVHTHHIGPLFYGGLAARLARVPRVIHTEHDAWHLKAARRRRLQGLLLSLARPVLVADAEAVAAEIRRCWPASDPHVIANGIDTDRFTPGGRAEARRFLKLPERAPLIGCAARLEAEKGHRFLIAALAELAEPTHLVLAGQGTLEPALRDQIEALGLRHRVHFLGHVDDMPAFYRALDVFCLASLNEGLPLSPLEAQACDVPAVLTDVGACGEALCPDTGVLVPRADVAALAGALTQQLRRRSVVGPRAYVCRHHDLRHVVSAYAAV